MPNVSKVEIDMSRVTVTETPVERIDPKSVQVFDFTIDPAGMDSVTAAVYYKVHRKAAFAHERAVASDQKPDMSLFPAGKKMTREQVESFLGGSIEEVLVPKECC